MVLDSVTLASLVVSGVAIGLAAWSLVWYRRSVQKLLVIDSRLDVYALVREFSERMNALEQRLVDQKVQFELFKLRATLTAVVSRASSVQNLSGLESVEKGVTDLASAASASLTRSKHRLSGHSSGQGRKEPVGSLEKEVLLLVAAGEGKTVARDVQLRINRSREHTARTMHELFIRGLLDRDLSSRPYTYSVTEKGRKFTGSS